MPNKIQREPWHLILLRVLIWLGATLVSIGPLASTTGTTAAAVAAFVGLLTVWFVVGTSIRWWWLVVVGLVVMLVGWIAKAWVGSSDWVAWTLGPGQTLALIEIILFGTLVFGAALMLRPLTLRWPAFGFAEAAVIVAAIAYSFRGHRQYPFSQPQILSDWAFANGYDPRHILLAVGVATLVGLGILLLPKQGIRRTLLASLVLLLLTWVCIPFLFGPIMSDVAKAISNRDTKDSKAESKNQNATPPPKTTVTPPNKRPDPESDNQKPNASKPGQSEPGESEPGESKPGESKPSKSNLLPPPNPCFGYPHRST